MDALTKDAILGIKDLDIKEHFVEKWQMPVYFLQLSAAAAEKWMSKLGAKNAKKDGNPSDKMVHIRAELLVITMCDADGNLLFDNTPGDIAAIEAKANDVLNDLFAASAEFNGLLDPNEEPEEGVGPQEALVEKYAGN